MYSEQQKKDISAKLRQTLTDLNMTDSEFIRRYDVQKKTYFNQVKNDTWGEYPKDDYWRYIAGLIGYTSGKTYWQIFDFPHYTNSLALLERAHKNQKFYVLDGNTGYGKSQAQREYLKSPRVESGKVWYYRHSDKDVTDREMVIQQLTLIGVAKAEGKPLEEARKPALMRTIISALKDTKNKGSLMMIDEMEYCNNACLQAIRKIIYETEGHVAIVLTGAGLIDRLERLASTRTALQNGWAQTWSRLKWNAKKMEGIGWDRSLAASSPRNAAWLKTVKIACKSLQIEDPKLIDWLARNTSNYRDLGHILPKIMEVADSKGLPVDVDLAVSLADSTLYSD